MKRNQEQYRGCLFGGAIGDAFGSIVEFLSIDAIREKYGKDGITDLLCSKSGLAEITDDTQMTLFTAEGILRAITRGKERGIWHPPTSIYYAYQRWLLTQGYPKHDQYEDIYKSWLLEIRELYASRAPGNTCLSALLSREMGTIEKPINNSKGCGGVMRVAPVALALIGLNYDKELIFELGAETGAITHGHPSGYLSAGALAHIIASIIEGSDIFEAVKQAAMVLKGYEGHDECSTALANAVEFADSGMTDCEAIKKLGEGWVGEEALAIAVYCALKYSDDFSKAIIASANHSGDSDSTGSITGNILGAYLGMNSIPKKWVEKLELREVIMKIADDLLVGYQENDEWSQCYPGF
jgi:ADP-ribosylglycohydrolase